jgi:eukaryotic-like serine/threonine-protein kinase
MLKRVTSPSGLILPVFDRDEGSMEGESGQRIAENTPGQGDATTEIIDHYLARLIALASSRLSPLLQDEFDPEDVVQAAYRCFCLNVPDQENALRFSGDLWRLLAELSVRKTGKNLETNPAPPSGLRREEMETGLQSKLQGEPTPEDASILVERLIRCMRRLKLRDRRILELRLRGETIDGIASGLAQPAPASTAAPKTVSTATIRRVLRDSREALEQGLDSD